LLLSIITLLRELFSGNAVRTKAGLVAAPVVEVVGGQGADVAAAPVAANAQVTMVQPTPQVALMEEDTTIDPELSISAVASRLINEGATCAVVISPEGDEASASSILLTRNISDQGLKVILLDLTANSAAARPMTDGLALAGITNLLAGSAQFGDIIHNDVYSDAHVIPTGTGDTAKAARAVERLPMIINALVSAYDMVIVECGPTTARGVKRLVVPGSGLLVSVVDIDHKAALAAMTDLIAAGYDDLILVSPLGSNSHEPMPDRYVA
jgi:Mrp family chromosome partitioning ATPase